MPNYGGLAQKAAPELAEQNEEKKSKLIEREMLLIIRHCG